jgi:1-acyl-sn-glycerol-3-phosphate acyltransferase
MSDDAQPARKPRDPIQLTSGNSPRVRLTRAFMRFLGDVLLFRTTAPLTVHGLENVPRTGPTLLLFNHLTLLDPPIMGAPIRFRDAIPIGKQELSRQLMTGWLAWLWDTIPLRRGEIDMQALRRALYVLNESPDMLAIAPEGQRNKALGRPKEGFVMLAVRAQAVMVPVGISGTQHFGRNLRRLRRTPITVRYGRPMRFKGKVTRADYLAAADEVMYQLSALIEPSLRGEYADLSAATMRYIEYVE